MHEIPSIPRDDSSWMSATCTKKARNTDHKDVTAAYNSPKEDTEDIKDGLVTSLKERSSLKTIHMYTFSQTKIWNTATCLWSDGGTSKTQLCKGHKISENKKKPKGLRHQKKEEGFKTIHVYIAGFVMH